MAALSKIEAQSPQSLTSEGLSPATAHNSRHRRSASRAPSEVSSQSVKTQVEDDSEIAVSDGKVKTRTNTTEVEITLSRWDCLKGLFVPGRTRRKIVSSMKVSGADDMSCCENNHDSPWIVNVYVLSNTKDKDTHYVRKEAQCTFDTGNLHGNIVSLELLTKGLGYTEADIQPLKGSEKKGGLSATGDILLPIGSVKLTWYYGRSTKVFRDMRFLVCKNPQLDLVIGARSIQKHNILSFPNLMVNQDGRTAPKFVPDLELQKLESKKAELDNLIDTYGEDLDDATSDGNKTNITKYQKLKEDTEKKFKVAELELDLYKAKKENTKRPTETNQALVAQIETDLEAAKEKLPKNPVP